MSERDYKQGRYDANVEAGRHWEEERGKLESRIAELEGELEEVKQGYNTTISILEGNILRFSKEIEELQNKETIETSKGNYTITESGDISDGYHTFSELYDHRCLLFLCWMCSDGCSGDVYWYEEHYPGWDLVVYYEKNIGQISYHIPIKYRHITQKLYNGDISEYKYDGHTSEDVLKRLEEWCK